MHASACPPKHISCQIKSNLGPGLHLVLEHPLQQEVDFVLLAQVVAYLPAREPEAGFQRLEQEIND
jgi:hypothetical protein